MLLQKIICQDRLWVFTTEELWDGIGYPKSENVWACLLTNEAEVADLEVFYQTMKERLEKESSDKAEQQRIADEKKQAEEQERINRLNSIEL